MTRETRNVLCGYVNSRRTTLAQGKAKEMAKKYYFACLSDLSASSDSNREPRRYKLRALTIELLAEKGGIVSNRMGTKPVDNLIAFVWFALTIGVTIYFWSKR